eukprot:TRINITY_DN3561_c0_g4_i2.p1 TRINITY_DN3561_c0_g4~~TRINITY_DN3561_c0_g4_i2.p1  ORF type:complete len:432 (+),score=55.15 TRINITY_DN3561_c0_g4_i2:157-1296(+)
MVVFGGQSIAGVLANDTYILKNILTNPEWHKLPIPDTVPRSSLSRWGHTMVTYHEPPNTISLITNRPVPPSGNIQLLVFGGMAESYESLDDILALEVSTLTWTVVDDLTSEQKPVGRRRHVAAMDPSDHCMWVFGGRSEWNIFHSDLWKFDFKTRCWTEVHTANPPMPRTGHCGAMHGCCLYVFGGFELRGPVDSEWDYMIYNDLHRFNTKTLVWEEISPSPSGGGGGDGVRLAKGRARQVACSGTGRFMCWETGSLSEDEGEGECGEKDSTHSSDMVGDVHVCADLKTPCQAPRKRSMATCFVYNDRLYVHGGRDKHAAFNCAFSVPLITATQPTLVSHIARYIIDTSIDYSPIDLTTDLNTYLDSLFASPPRLSIRE